MMANQISLNITRSSRKEGVSFGSMLHGSIQSVIFVRDFPAIKVQYKTGVFVILSC